MGKWRVFRIAIALSSIAAVVEALGAPAKFN